MLFLFSCSMQDFICTMVYCDQLKRQYSGNSNANIPPKALSHEKTQAIFPHSHLEKPYFPI